MDDRSPLSSFVRTSGLRSFSPCRNLPYNPDLLFPRLHPITPGIQNAYPTDRVPGGLVHCTISSPGGPYHNPFPPVFPAARLKRSFSVTRCANFS